MASAWRWWTAPNPCRFGRVAFSAARSDVCVAPGGAGDRPRGQASRGGAHGAEKAPRRAVRPARHGGGRAHAAARLVRAGKRQLRVALAALAALYLPLQRGRHHGDGAAGHLGLVHSAHRGRVSARHSGCPQLPAHGAFRAAGALRAGLRRARGRGAVHSRHPHRAAQIPQRDGLAHFRADARFALRHRVWSGQPDRTASADEPCDL